MGFKFFFILSLILCFISPVIIAQEAADSIVTTIAVEDGVIASDEIIEIETDTLENRPNTAVLYSAVVPGLGQAYNKKYWKIPLLYGGGLVLGYFINYNHQLYTQYRDGLIAIIDKDDRTEPFDPRLDEKDYQRAVDYWRRNRDLLMIGVLLVYVINIVDANVDAHLELFTVDEDISLNLEPSINQTAMQTNLIGVSLILRFN